MLLRFVQSEGLFFMVGFENVRALSFWGMLGAHLKLVHTIRYTYTSITPNTNKFEQSELVNKPAKDVFANWDVFSASLIDMRHKPAQIINKPRNTHLFAEIGIVLNVPMQNILGTHASDVSFPNHIGTENELGFVRGTSRVDPSALSRAIFSGTRKPVQQAKYGSVQGGHNQIMSPTELISKTLGWNEVLIVGRPGVNIYQGLPATGNITAQGIIVAAKHAADQEGRAKLVEVAQRLASINGFPGYMEML